MNLTEQRVREIVREELAALHCEYMGCVDRAVVDFIDAKANGWHYRACRRHVSDARKAYWVGEKWSTIIEVALPP